MASSRSIPKPPIAKKPLLVLNFSKPNVYFNSKQCSGVPHYTNVVTDDQVTLPSKHFKTTENIKQGKKPIPKPRKLKNNVTPPVKATPSESPNPAAPRRAGKTPMPLPRPASFAPGETEDIYDDIMVSKQHSISSTQLNSVYDDASSYPLEGVYDDASSYPLEGVYDDASSFKYGPPDTASSKPVAQQSDNETPNKSPLPIYNRTCHIVLDSNKISFPVRKNVANKDRDEPNIATPSDYIYPCSHSQQRASPLNKSLEYDYASQDISLSTETSVSQLSSTHGVFAKKDYDYAYQHEASPSPTVKHKYYYITTSTESETNPTSFHSYETIDTIPHNKTASVSERRSVTSKPPPDTVRCDQLLSSGEDYDEIGPKPSQYVNNDLPVQMRQRTRLLVRGPTKEKLYSSLRNRKSKDRPSIFDVFPDSKSSSRAVVSAGSATQHASKGENDHYDTIPSEVTRTYFDKLLEANGVHFSPSSGSTRRHSLTSSESQSELLSLSVGHQEYSDFLQTSEFDQLKDFVYTELRDYKDAGIVHVRPRHQIARDIQSLTEGAPLSPPPLPQPRPLPAPHQRTGSIESVRV